MWNANVLYSANYSNYFSLDTRAEEGADYEVQYLQNAYWSTEASELNSKWNKRRGTQNLEAVLRRKLVHINFSVWQGAVHYDLQPAGYYCYVSPSVWQPLFISSGMTFSIRGAARCIFCPTVDQLLIKVIVWREVLIKYEPLFARNVWFHCFLFCRPSLLDYCEEMVCLSPHAGVG